MISMTDNTQILWMMYLCITGPQMILNKSARAKLFKKTFILFIRLIFKPQSELDKSL